MNQQQQTTSNNPVKETYICNGSYFHSYDEVLTYAASINCRVSNTETISNGKYLITLSAI